MQPFICPDCGHQSTFDPLAASALCPRCGFTPPTDGRKSTYVRDIDMRQQRLFLTELLSHWDGTHQPDGAASLPTPQEAQGFYWAYRRALGGMARKQPGEQEILEFATAYVHLRRGEREKAAQLLHELSSSAPAFADAWVWLTATTEDPAALRGYLQTALLIEPNHPLAGKALAVGHGTALASAGEEPLEVSLVQCPHCGCAVSHDPGATAECPFCQAGLVVPQDDLPAP
jgi:predicted Zn-ribbon and HTH transcriptional regulator